MSRSEFTDAKLVELAKDGKVWAVNSLAIRLASAKHLLMRCSTLASHMVAERVGFWNRLLLGRWYLCDEPLRSDAARLLPDIGKFFLDGDAIDPGHEAPKAEKKPAPTRPLRRSNRTRPKKSS